VGYVDPQISPVPQPDGSNNQSGKGDMLENASDWASLYPRLRAGDLPTSSSPCMIGDLRSDANYSAQVQGNEAAEA
jgi:hypothetical protein